jgi:hypothetical protein
MTKLARDGQSEGKPGARDWKVRRGMRRSLIVPFDSVRVATYVRGHQKAMG